MKKASVALATTDPMLVAAASVVRQLPDSMMIMWFGTQR